MVRHEEEEEEYADYEDEESGEYDEYEDEEDAEYEEYDEEAGAGHVFEKILLALLIGLSVGGVAVADFSAERGLLYWLGVVPVFALASLIVGWRNERADGLTVPRIVARQIFHWAPLAAAIYLVFFLEQAGRFNRDDAGLVSLLLLAVATLTAGVHFDWRLFVVGGLLAVTTACVAIVEEYLWWFLIAAAVVSAGAVYFWPRRGE